MLDIKFIRENPNILKEALKKRRVKFNVDYLLDLDQMRREKINQIDKMRSEQNLLSQQIAELKGEAREKKIRKSKKVKEKLQIEQEELKRLENDFFSLLYQLPNIPLEETPVGKDEKDNVVLREVGKKPKFNFKPQDYMKIASKLDLIDTQRAAKVSGSRFGYLKKDVVLLEFALVRFALDILSKKNFIPVLPPVLIKKDIMKNMGYIDTAEDLEERYFLEKDKLFLVGTSEQSLGPMHTGEILEEKALPLRYAGFSSCFRREAGSYGKDTHGILRVHQFDKVEMFIFSLPENSKKEHQLMIDLEEKLMQKLKIPYRVVALCTGDIARPSAATYDIEAWLPGQNEGKGQYRETHSSSNTTDFQARRLNIRVRRKDGRVEFVHMLNGTAFAIGRMIIAIIENYQQKDGSIRIPRVLQPYMEGQKIIKP